MDDYETEEGEHWSLNQCGRGMVEGRLEASRDNVTSASEEQIFSLRFVFVCVFEYREVFMWRELHVFLKAQQPRKRCLVYPIFDTDILK